MMVVAALFVLAVIGLLVPLPFPGRVASSIGDMVHGPLFGGLTWAAIALAQRIWGPTSRGRYALRCIGLGVVVFLFGLAMEWLQQSSTMRSGSSKDAIANGFGVMMAISVAIGLDRRSRFPSDVRTPRILWIFAGVFLAASWWQPVAMLRDVRAVRADFPLLGSLESKVELKRWHFKNVGATLTKEDVTHGKRAMELVFRKSDHASATIIDMVHDWSAMDTLELDLALDADHVEPTASIDVRVIEFARETESRKMEHWGASSDHTITLERGESKHVVIAASELVRPSDGQPIDLSKVHFFELQINDVAVVTTIRVDFIRLRL